MNDFTVICMCCRQVKIVNPDGTVEWYALEYPPAGRISHGLCQECSDKYYPEEPINESNHSRKQNH